MSEIAKLTVHPRTGTGSRAAVKLRKAGKIPAVVYGHNEGTAHIAVDAVELNRAIRVLHARTFSLTINGKTDTVLIKELQWDHLGSDMVHVDFERHDLTEKVKVTVPIELRNSPKTMSGGVLDQPLHQLHILCPLGSIPEAIRVDILNLTLGHPIHVSELKLPEGVVAVDKGDMVVVQIKLPGAEAVVEDTTGAEPEVLTAKKPKDGEEE
jgi:large subunit ribosomal protein L25